MEFFIKIVDGQPFEHPILGDNFREAYPDIDTANLPSNFARFERVEQPVINKFQVVEGPVYQWVNGVVKDVWSVREMNDAERAQVIQQEVNFANELHQETIIFVQNSFAKETDETVKQAWNDWLVQLNAWEIVDPNNIPNFPQAPDIIKQMYGKKR